MGVLAGSKHMIRLVASVVVLVIIVSMTFAAQKVDSAA